MHRFLNVSFARLVYPACVACVACLVCLSASAALGVLTPVRACAQSLTLEQERRQTEQWNARKLLHRSIEFALLGGLGGTAHLPHSDVNLEPAYGFAMRYEHPLMRYLVLGGQFDLESWTTAPWSRAPAAGHSTLFDFQLLTKLRYPIPDRAEFYAGMPFGAVINSGNDGAFGGRTRIGLGWGIGALAGARFATSRSTGFAVELGMMHRAFEHVIVPSTGGHYRIPMSMLQPQIMFGLFARI